ncbi:hypothetical protein CJ430_31120, partial [Klebsiella pneumoniae]
MRLLVSIPVSGLQFKDGFLQRTRLAATACTSRSKRIQSASCWSGMRLLVSIPVSGLQFKDGFLQRTRLAATACTSR